MSWTEEKVAKLKELWSKGHTASQIAEALGDTTRNAVIGKAHRLNLEARAPSKQVIQQSFSHSSSSFMIKKIDGTIVDLLFAPLSPGEVTLSIALSAVTRSVVIGIVSIIVFKLIINIEIKNYYTLIAFTLLSSFILGNIGIIAGLWAEKFDHMATVTNFVIVPLSFLSGTFYSIERLPGLLQAVSKVNPFFYMIDGFRYSFIGTSDGSIFIGLVYLTALSFVSWLVCYLLYKKGYKIKS